MGSGIRRSRRLRRRARMDRSARGDWRTALARLSSQTPSLGRSAGREPGERGTVVRTVSRSDPRRVAPYLNCPRCGLSIEVRSRLLSSNTSHNIFHILISSYSCSALSSGRRAVHDRLRFPTRASRPERRRSGLGIRDEDAHHGRAADDWGGNSRAADSARGRPRAREACLRWRQARQTTVSRCRAMSAVGASLRPRTGGHARRPGHAPAPLSRVPGVRPAAPGIQPWLGAPVLPQRPAAGEGAVQPVLRVEGASGQVASIASTGDTIQGTFKAALRYPSTDAKATPTTLFATQVPAFWNNDQLTALLQAHDVQINAQSTIQTTPLLAVVAAGIRADAADRRDHHPVHAASR